MEEPRYKAEYICGRKAINQKICQTFTSQNNHGISIFLSQDKGSAPAALVLGSGKHCHAKYKSLLKHQYQHCRYKECLESVSGVEHGYVFILNRHGHSLLLPIRQTGEPLYLDVSVHIQRHYGTSAQHSLVVEQAAHITIQVDGCLTAFGKCAFKLRGNMNHTVCLMTVHQVACLLHIRAV